MELYRDKSSLSFLFLKERTKSIIRIKRIVQGQVVFVFFLKGKVGFGYLARLALSLFSTFRKADILFGQRRPQGDCVIILEDFMG